MGARDWIRRCIPAAVWSTGTALVVGTVAWAVWQLAVSHRLSAIDQAGILSLPIGTFCAVVAIPPFFGWLADRRGIDLDRASAQLARAVQKQEGKERVRLLGNDTMAINVEFDFAPSVGRDAAGARASGSFQDVLGYYRRLRPRRMVITGEPGAGKTVLAIELILALLVDRGADDPVPVRLSLPGWDLRSELAEWLAASVADTYDLSSRAANALVDAGLVLPVLDGLDEMDPGQGSAGKTGAGKANAGKAGASKAGADKNSTGKDSAGKDSAGRAAELITRLNDYRTAGQPGALVLTSRDAEYEELVAAGGDRLRDAAQVRIQPVTPEQAADYLLSRAGNAERWWPVCEHLVTHQDSVLAGVLSTPWRLNLTFTVYEQAEDPAKLLGYTDSAALHEDLLRSYVPIVTGRGARYSPAKVVAWLGELARYLQDNSATDRQVGGAKLSGSDIDLFELWPLGGVRRVLRLDDMMAGPALVLAAAPFMTAEIAGAWSSIWRGLVPLGIFLATREIWPARKWMDHNVKRARVIGWLVFAIAVLVAWWFARQTHWYRDFSSPVLPAVIIFLVLFRGLRTSSQETRSVIAPRAAIRNSLADGLLAGVILGIIVAALLVATTGLTRSPGGLAVLAAASAAAALLWSVYVAGLWRRYLALLLATRGRLPWRLGRFLDWASTAGLLRMAGSAYQFRHRELQEYLALPAAGSPPRRAEVRDDTTFLSPRAHKLLGLRAQDQPAAWAASWPGALAAALALAVLAAVGTGAVAGLRDHTALADIAPDATANLKSMFTDLSDDMAHRSDADFLSWVAPGVRPRVALWWQNLHDLGFTNGAIGFYEEYPYESLPVDSHGDTPAALIATGGYNRQDPVNASGKVYMSVTGRYRVVIHQIPGDRPVIVSWQPFDDAPWDAPVRLYVRRAAGLVVAAYPDEKAAADQAFAQARAAAGYTTALFRNVDRGGLRQPGFLVFVSAHPARRRWFADRFPNKHWPAGPDAALAFTTANEDFYNRDVIAKATDYAGGVARVVLTPAAGGAESASLVSAFTEAILVDDASEDNAAGGWFEPAGGWGLAGFGRFVAALYQASPEPVIKWYSYRWLNRQLAALPKTMLAGQVPTPRQVTQGTASQVGGWSDVAATVYAYIGARWDTGQAFFAAVEAVQNPGETPFDEVWESYSKKSGKVTSWYPAATVKQGWKDWLLHFYR